MVKYSSKAARRWTGYIPQEVVEFCAAVKKAEYDLYDS